MTQTSRPSTLYSVQAFRGIAALLVVLYHLIGTQKRAIPAERVSEISMLTGFWDQGYAGVDLFFVISGFIMVYVTQNAPRNLKGSARFLFARASRIYPLWWVYLGVMMLYFLAAYGQVSQPNYGTEISDIIRQTVRSIFLMPQKAMPILITGWTLVHEMMFYIVFAFVLLLPRAWLPWVMIFWAALVPAAVTQFGAPVHSPNYLVMVFSPLSLEFIFGALTAWILLKTHGRWAKTAIMLGVIGLSLALVIGIDLNGPPIRWNEVVIFEITILRVLIYGLPFAVLLYGVVVLERAGRLRTPQWLVRLGDWSYSLYLSHLLVVMTLVRLAEAASPYLPAALRHEAEGLTGNIIFTGAAIAACVIFSALSYHLIEQPLLRGARKIWPRKAVAASAA